MTPKEARSLLEKWVAEGRSIYGMVKRYYSREVLLPDGGSCRGLTEDGAVLEAEVHRLDEVRAMIEAATYFANDE